MDAFSHAYYVHEYAYGLWFIMYIYGYSAKWLWFDDVVMIIRPIDKDYYAYCVDYD